MTFHFSLWEWFAKLYADSQKKLLFYSEPTLTKNKVSIYELKYFRSIVHKLVA